MKRIVRGVDGSIAYEDPYFDNISGNISTINSNSCKYPLRLCMYEDYPTQEIRLEQLEKLAISRLKRNLFEFILVLKVVENFNARIQHGGSSDPILLSTSEEKLMPLHSNATARAYSVDEERLNDRTSHFVLRLGFCRKEELRRWFTNQETALFRYRFQHLLSAEEKAKFISTYFPQLLFISDSDLELNMQNLLTISPSADSHYYKVPFENVPDLVARRSVFIIDGWAYVHRSEVLSIIISSFKNTLERELLHTASALPFVGDDERIFSLLEAISAGDDVIDGPMIASSSAKLGKLSSADIDKAAVYFPPCMLQLHRKLKEDGHLKHVGRMQYGLYLKSIGVGLDDAIIFWKKSFAKKLTEDVFQKNYLYNIRHNYGQEGKRTNYPPYSCHRIITSSPPQPGGHDLHGCPFRHQSKDSLAAWLSSVYSNTSLSGSKQLNSGAIKELLEVASSGHYQLACTRLLESFRGSSISTPNSTTKPSSAFLDSSGGVITYPHQFYEHSISCCQQS